ncbi:2-succinyl-6-hydroxy-2,4-cyclohexadiene-1-carboxylate synthase [Lelliottia sp. F153]|uniref:2-succinyl-6-hydroxy-2, 4-cyclohexadiene-1-carboxylate synthase n=1 Tax=unclassified Lelliottia TaxID=2642424 RepID=UPI000C7EF92A|nr:MULTISPECIES: 2-succinyl-6-hydroxy-2,4-cyclohexadiene-1-carboxylate synthase [unclassified Lelliottia]PLY45085.1 2-succinyl-6-hydroxy-2,4-cyclohexadiene-1-carboxylate synthase [Lelliottia sp. F159]PLY49999.1 2-succinyl-6-hydroxy-2,4-cyclohexadiene-1-carboxylate synthase [Lelliottia sp. F154]PLY55647.1 2-succinyl-6-hydroxy-2,4-cyclohexadiene-1-carboxylate synthase [Lelliottia sp. F153]
MILAGQRRAGKPGLPWLVFLHGFSGDCREWQTVGAKLPDHPQLYLDLPGHGGSQDIAVSGFSDVSQLLTNTLLSYNILNYWLVGYSLGGRVAMVHACQQPKGLAGLIVEGGHPGLCDAKAREARAESDRRWAQRFRDEPLLSVFRAWYQQPVFASLTDAQRDELITLRSQNNGATLASMLQATSLANQPDLRAALNARTTPFHYVYGERDEKFAALAAELNAERHVIPNAGHNAHRDNSAAVAASLAQILRFRIKDIP